MKTDINQGAGDITAEESVRGILQGEQRAQQAQRSAHAHALRRPAAAGGILGQLSCALALSLPHCWLRTRMRPALGLSGRSVVVRALAACLHETLPPCFGTWYRTAVLEGGNDLHGRFYSWAGDELPW